MKFLKLLAAGTSLIGLNKAGPRYRMSTKRLLPRFPASENPFRATVLPSQGGGPSEEHGPSEAGQVGSVGPQPGRDKGAGSFRRFVGMLKAGRGSAEARDRQGELSLDQVKVIRNDLSEYDEAPLVARRPVTTVEKTAEAATSGSAALAGRPVVASQVGR